MTGIMKPLPPIELEWVDFAKKEESTSILLTKLYDTQELPKSNVVEFPLDNKEEFTETVIMVGKPTKEKVELGPFENWLVKNKDKITIDYKKGFSVSSFPVQDIFFIDGQIVIQIKEDWIEGK
jgi:hypothetical protein